MNHLEAQSYIMPFIEGKVPENRQADFVMHMNNCPKCHEELEVYYTLLSGMRQLDGRETVSGDFSKNLAKELGDMEKKVKNRRTFRLSAFSIFLAAAIVVIMAVYAGGLNKVYKFEQDTKLSNQGEAYFANELGTYLIYDKTDNIKKSEYIDSLDDVSDFDRIRGFNRLEEDYNSMMDVGEELADVEVTTD